MSKEMKLQCPLCRTKFITKKRNNIWCSVKCRDIYTVAKKGIEENKMKQQSFINPNLEYNLETDKFKIKGWIPTKSWKK
tara:strand:- start:654 stop:890 length:237 start_codon:yes stop_codon:yes gene_type:complete